MWFCFFPPGAGGAVALILYLIYRYPEDKWTLDEKDWKELFNVQSMVVSGAAGISFVT
jgi:hypothetical protein